MVLKTDIKDLGIHDASSNVLCFGNPSYLLG